MHQDKSDTGDLQYRGHYIEDSHLLSHPSTLWKPTRQRQHQGHLDQLIVERMAVLETSVIEELLTMIAHEDNERFVP